MVNYHKMPLVLTADVSRTFKKIREEVIRVKDTVRIEKDENLEILVRGLGGNDHFFFHVSEPKFNTTPNKNIVYTIEFCPKNETSISNGKTATSGVSLLKTFSHWIANLQRYNNINIHPTDSINEQYEKEFDDWFEIVDEDAESNAFDAKQQLLIQNIIDKSILLLIEEGVKEDDPLIEEAKWIKTKLGEFTKKQVVNAVKKIYPKLRKKGLDMTKKVYDVWANEMIAMGYRETIRGLGEFFMNYLLP